MRVILALLVGLFATVEGCSPSSTASPPTTAPGAPGPSLVLPVPSGRGPSPTIEIPPPID